MTAVATGWSVRRGEFNSITMTAVSSDFVPAQGGCAPFSVDRDRPRCDTANGTAANDTPAT